MINKDRAIRSKSSTMVGPRPLDANQQLRSVLFANEIATWTWDVANDRVVADNNLNRLFGFTSVDGGGEPIEKFIQLIHPDDRGRVSAAIASSLEGPDDN